MKVFFIVLTLILTSISYAAEVVDFERNVQMLGFDRYYSELRKSRNREAIKIAVLDYGFGKYEKEKGYTIPENTQLKMRPQDKGVLDEHNTHGLVMAQIITQYMTNNYERWSFAPELYLYKADGYSNFEWAIEDAIATGIDIILHSIVIEYGGNYDGRGFFNSLVNRAIQAGIIWVNASGNFGQTTYNARVNFLEDSNWVEFEGLENNALPIQCDLSQEKKRNKKCSVRIVLSWDDFKNEPLVGSTKDLDLFLYDKNFEKVIASDMTQIEYNDKRSGDAGATLYPREIIETEIPNGISYVKVRAKTDNFSSRDTLRITADGDNIIFPHRDREENLLNPADNPYVITVGEDTERSSVSKLLKKPEIIAPSLVKGDDGRKYRGSSNAAATVAAGIGLMKKLNPYLDREEILNLALNRSQDHRSPSERVPFPNQTPDQRIPLFPGALPFGNLTHELDQAVFVQSSRIHHERPTGSLPIPLEVLGFGPPPRVGCFPLVNVDQVEPCTVADFIIKSRSILVGTTQGAKIATTFDPLLLLQDLRTGGPDLRASFRDVVAIMPTYDPRGAFIRLPRGKPLPPGAIEIFQVPLDVMPCKLPDWDFMSRQRDLARDNLYAATRNQGTDNIPISPMCDPRNMMQVSYPTSDWSIYPPLRHSPYISPVGPASVRIDIPHHDGYREYEGHGHKENTHGERFRLPDPSYIRDGED